MALVLSLRPVGEDLYSVSWIEDRVLRQRQIVIHQREQTIERRDIPKVDDHRLPFIGGNVAEDPARRASPADLNGPGSPDGSFWGARKRRIFRQVAI